MELSTNPSGTTIAVIWRRDNLRGHRQRDRLTAFRPVALHSIDRRHYPLATGQRATVPTECELVRVSRQMASQELMQNAVVTALQPGERRFGRVLAGEPSAYSRYPEKHLRVVIDRMMPAIVAAVLSSILDRLFGIDCPVQQPFTCTDSI